MAGRSKPAASGLAVALLFTLIPSATAVVSKTMGNITFECPDGWKLEGPDCYLLVDAALPLDAAIELCKKYGSRLVNIRDEVEAMAVGGMVQTHGASGWDHYWIGNGLEEETSPCGGLWSVGQPKDVNAPPYRLSADTPLGRWTAEAVTARLPSVCRSDACVQGTFRCRDGKKCLSNNWMCDGELDCDDQSDESNCAALDTEYLYQSTGTLTQNQGYAAGKTSMWTIEGTDPAMPLSITFSSLNVEEDVDYVEVWSGGPSLGASKLQERLTGQLTASKKVYGVNNFIIVRLVADLSNQLPGFVATWAPDAELSMMDRQVAVTDVWQDVVSPYVDSSPAPRAYTRKYTLSAPQGSLITMEVTVNELGSGFRFDSGDLNPIGDGRILPAFYITRSNSITFYLETGASDDPKKFKARVKTGCSAEFSRANGFLSAPGSPYPPSVTCSYTVRIPQDSQGAFQLNFINLSLADEKDSVTVYDGANSSATRLSYAAGTPFVSTGSVVFVEFTSSLVETSGSFNLSYDMACPALTQTSNMGVSSASTSYGAVLTLNCSTGFAFEQEEFVHQAEVVMECGTGGQWNVSRLPTCATIYCGIPVTPQNGFIEAGNGASYDDTVTYSCYEGFTLDGTNVSTCGVMSAWSGTPTCQASVCPQLVNLTDGSHEIVIGGGTDFGTIANYSCNPGFDLIGSKSSLCQTNGSWSYPPPTCQRIKCPIPEIERATLTPLSEPVDFEGSLTVQCDTGFNINASVGQTYPSMTYPCLASGFFGVSKDVCIDVDECLAPPCIAANTTCANTVGSYTCLCQEKYQADASGACQPINRCALNTSGCDSRHGECVASADQTDYTCRCQEGYVLFAQDGLSGRTLPALENGATPGDVLHLNHTCVPVQCAPPANLTNGRLLTNKMIFDFEETAEYHCEFGYNLVGSSRVTCNSSGTWDMGPPSCQAQLCDAVQPTGLVMAVYPNSTSSPGDSVMLECYSQSREVNYNKTLFCAYDNDTDSFKLQGDAPHCPAIDCGSVDTRGGVTFNITESGLGASFTFGCVETYTLGGVSAQGNSTVVCQKNGRWDLGNLTCNGERCTDPGTPGGMEQESANFELNGKVNYRCLRSGFVPEPAALTCIVISNSTTWDAALPVCKDVTNPIFSHCPQATINVKLYGSASDEVAMPTATDNSGLALLSVEPAWFMWNSALPEGQHNVTYTASDADNNTAVCNVTIQVSDPATPPPLTCPDYLTLEVTSLTARTVDLRDNVTSDSNVTLSFRSGPLTTVSPDTRGKTAVRVIATDSVGLQQQCAFVLDIEAVVCIEKDLTVGNATVLCSETAGANLSCSVTCLAGFAFSDGSPHRNYSCQANQWSPKLPASPCLRETKSEYLYEHEILYDALGLQGHKECLETGVRTHISSATTTLCQLYAFNQLRFLTFNVSSYQDRVINPDRIQVNIALALTDETVSATDINNCNGNMADPQRIKDMYGVNNLSCGGSVTLISSEYLGSRRSCILGLVLINDKCVPCGPGTKYVNNTYCEECPDGYYQDLIGQDDCKACPNGAIFSSEPRVSAEQCVASCEMGFSNGQNHTASPEKCIACPVDYYLDVSYTADCKPCAEGKTTYGVEGAMNAAACLDKCAAGRFPVNSTVCAPCPQGFFKEAVANTVCTACDANKTTTSTGSVAQSNCVDVTPVGCQNGGVALIEDHRSVCRCALGYTGNLCESYVDACLSDPCYNGATCALTGPNAFNCTCLFNAECFMVKNPLEYITDNVTYFDGVDENTCKQKCVDEPTCSAIHYYSKSAARFGCSLIYKPTPLTYATVDSVDITSFIKECGVDPLFNGSRCETDLVPDCNNDSCSDLSFCRDLINKTDCVCPTDSKFQGPKCTIDVTVCDPNPCNNSATCVDSGEGVRSTCLCLPGYTGEHCQTNIDDCAANPDGCLYQGVCADGVDKYTCTCGDYQGDRCEKTPVFCDISPNFCTNGICINDYNISSAVCNCDFPYRRGSDGRCEEIPLCSERNPCSNNATCESVVPGETRCKCLDGYGGTLCQHDINDCADNPCARGQCVDMINGFTCTCPPGYNGTLCENDLDDCLTNTCVNSSTERCQDGVNRFTCLCKTGYTGDNCQTDVDGCVSLPCRHNGTCAKSLTAGEYTCNCVDGWTGPNCESLDQFCSADTCTSRGECYSLQSDYFCSCVGGSSGKSCTTFTDLCNTLNPCKNPSTCTFADGQATCKCPTDYSGSSCNLREDSCSAKPCQNGGTCKPGALGYTCDCQEGYSGDNCSTSASPCDTAGCPATSNCTVLDGKALCLCPAGKIRTGSICKDLDSNFDIYFAKKGDPIRSSQPFTLTKREMTLMFYFAPLDNFGDSNVVELRLSNGTSILSVNNGSVTLGRQEVTLEDIQMRKWNHISINRSSTSYQLVLNGVRVETNSLVPDADYPPLNMPMFVYVGGAFAGYVSQVTVWQRSVSYDHMLDLYGNSTARPAGYSTDLVARWSHYGLSDNLLARVAAPSSYAKGGVVCPGGASGCSTDPPPTKSLPAVMNCPNDTDRAPARVLQINDLFNGENMHSNMDDTRVTYGVHRLVFMSQDSLNNVAFCRFTAYVRRMFPSGGQQSCGDLGSLSPVTTTNCEDGSKGRTVNCGVNKKAPLSPNILSCGKLGSYNLQNPDLWADTIVCGDVSPLKYKITLTLKYILGVTPCSLGEETTLRTELKKKVKTLQATWSDLCPDSNCNNANTDTVKCNAPQSGNVSTTVVLTQVPATLTNGSWTLSAKELLQTATLEFSPSAFDMSDVYNGQLQTGEVVIVAEPSCQAGYGLHEDGCVECAAGSFLNATTGMCQLCAIGTYTSTSTAGNSQCDPCESGKTTFHRGATSCESDNCAAGQGQGLSPPCEACAKNFYSNATGQLFCTPCPADKATQTSGANTKDLCFSTCAPGTQLNGSECSPCPRGMYNDGVTTENCTACKAGLTTQGERTVSETMCNQAACDPGNFRSNVSNTCEVCDYGYYQPERWQDQCLKCDPDYTTANNASTNASHCQFVCPAGYNVTSPGVCGPCDRGTYKSNDGPAKFGTCQACNSPYTTDGVAATSLGNCSIPMCEAGQIVGSGGVCEACPADTYQDVTLPTSSTGCTPCPDETGTRQNKSSASSDCTPFCEAGKQYNISSARCEPCPMGAFNTGSATQRFLQCQACPVGYTTAGGMTGATSGDNCTLRDCPAGSKIEGDNCTLCPFGTYQTTPRQTLCTECRPNTNTSTEGNDEAADCTIECDAGKEQTPGTESDCQACAEDFVKEVRGPGKCVQCTGNQTASSDRSLCNVCSKTETSRKVVSASAMFAHLHEEGVLRTLPDDMHHFDPGSVADSNPDILSSKPGNVADSNPDILSSKPGNVADSNPDILSSKPGNVTDSNPDILSSKPGNVADSNPDILSSKPGNVADSNPDILSSKPGNVADSNPDILSSKPGNVADSNPDVLPSKPGNVTDSNADILPSNPGNMADSSDDMHDSDSDYVPSDTEVLETDDSASCASDVLPSKPGNVADSNPDVLPSKPGNVTDSNADVLPSNPGNMADSSDDMHDSDPDYVPSHTEVLETDDSASCASDVYPMLTSRPSYQAATHTAPNDKFPDNSTQPVEHFGDDPTSDSSMNMPASTARIAVLDSSEKKFWVCLFCMKKQKKLPRHLRDKHANEESVQEYMQCKDTQEKKLLLYKLRNMGNHLHNTKVLRERKGQLVVSHCPSADSSSPHGFVPCLACYGYFKEKLLYKHRCPVETAHPRRKGLSKVKKGKLLLPVCGMEGKREEFVSFLHSFRLGDVALVVKNDRLIMQLTELEFDRNGFDLDKHNGIRSKVRGMGRLLLELRKISSKGSAPLSHFISPDMVETVLTATRNICGFQSATQTYSCPSLAVKLGTSVKTCAVLLKASAIELSDSEVEKKADQFVQLLELKWNAKVSRHATRCLNDRKRNKAYLLPAATDIVKLSVSLQEKAKYYCSSLASAQSCTPTVIETWCSLNEVVLTQCILFNRRRQGEVAKMKLRDYENCMSSHDEETFASVLTPLEQQLCKKLTRIEVQGKRDRTVPVLLTSDMKASLDVLVKTRSLSGVAETNTFLFPRTHFGSLGHLRGSDTLRDQANDCGADHPEWITSTKLRKQIATLAQVLNLKDNEMDILANFMGHDLRIHRDYYRLPERALQAAKVSKILFALEKGTLTNFSGKCLDDVTVTVEDDLEEDGEQDMDEDSAKQQAGEDSPDGCPQRKTGKDLEEDGEQDMDEDSARQQAGEDSPDGCPQRKTGKGRSCRRAGVKRRKWEDRESRVVRERFAAFIFRGRLPGKSDIENVQKEEPMLLNRTWRNIKDFIRNDMLKN